MPKRGVGVKLFFLLEYNGGLIAIVTDLSGQPPGYANQPPSYVEQSVIYFPGINFQSALLPPNTYEPPYRRNQQQ